MASKSIAAIVGGGVIGGGWAARFLLHGWDVCLYDPDPQAARKVETVLSNARHALPGLYDEALPEEGQLNYCTTVADAVADAGWIQESVPERLAAKEAVLEEIQRSASSEAVIASSTSGFRPSELAKNSVVPGQILVAHPYNPVYLLPLVELVTHPACNPEVVHRAKAITQSIGMKPIVFNKEIDAHIGDRLLEAVWREALWLVKDDYATTEEIDDVIRYSFGLRWAQMGLFETYRIAGGEAGMRHFISQFAPALQWPWSRLTDVPALDEDLTNKIADQSDQQSGSYTIRELERQRDNNLIAMMRALKIQNWGAGALLKVQDNALQQDSALQIETTIEWDQPINTVTRTVPSAWTNARGCMSETHYLEIAMQAGDRLTALLGSNESYRESGYGYVPQTQTIKHQGEAYTGDQLQVLSKLNAVESTTLSLTHEIQAQDNRLLATVQQTLKHIDLKSGAEVNVLEPLKSRLVSLGKPNPRD